MAVSGAKGPRQARVAAYKAILRASIDQRPSGIRQKISEVLGTHKSFISQITNPADPTPIPQRHLDAIIDVCHLSPLEQRRFLAAYRAAHPEHVASEHEVHRRYRTLHIQIPVLGDARRQRELESLIRDTVRRLCNLVAGPRGTADV